MASFQRAFTKYTKIKFCYIPSSTKKISCDFQLILENKCVNQEKCIKYLGVFIDSRLSWKSQIQYILTKIKRSVGILSKIRYYGNINVLSNLYYALIYPFFYLWNNCVGQHLFNNSPTSFILRKRAVRLMTFTSFHEHSSPIVKIEHNQAG